MKTLADWVAIFERMFQEAHSYKVGTPEAICLGGEWAGRLTHLDSGGYARCPKGHAIVDARTYHSYVTDFQAWLADSL